MIFFGRNIVKEALSSKYNAKELFLQDGINESFKIKEIINLATEKSVKINYTSHKELTHICSNSDEHQGVAISVDYSTSKITELSEDPNATYIYISTATFEHNIGAITRTAEVAGFSGVIIPKNINITSTVAKTSAGAIFHIDMYKESIFNAIKKFKTNGYRIMAIERGGEIYYNTDLTGQTLLIIGGEDKSISEPLMKKCDNILTIPQYGEVNSLNMSIASAIVSFEKVRQVNQ